MKKAYRILFDVICIVAILLLPCFALELIGIDDYILKEVKHDENV